MKLRDILVVLDGSARSEVVLGVALGLARQHDAHLTGFCPLAVLSGDDPAARDSAWTANSVRSSSDSSRG